MFSTNDNLEIDKYEEQYTAYGVCRCCLAKGQHRDVTKEYCYKNIKEVYKDKFLECFNFLLSSHIGISSLICDDCVLRLRDATSFYRMVAATEAQLLNAIVVKSDPDTITGFDSVPGLRQFTADVKKEIKSENHDDEDNELLEDVHSILEIMPATSHNDDHKQMADIIDDDGDDDSPEDELVIDDDVEYVDDNDVYCSSVTRNATSAKDDEPCEIIEKMKLLGRSPAPVQTEPKRTDLQVWPQNDDLKKLKDKQSLIADETVKSLELFFNIPGLKKDTLMPEKQVLARNATTIFKWSNASAFKPKVKNGYPCFFCRKVCKPDKLREHQEKHKKSTLFNRIRNYYSEVTFVIYADITNLKCTICKKNIRNLIDLRDHLTVQHSKKIYASADRVIPFKLKESEFDCQVCGEMFETFNKVENHMNVHYGSYFCETCGTGFMTKHRLKLHNYSAHRVENVICELCKKCFRTQRAYRGHYEVVHHQVKKYTCRKCPEKFVCCYARRRHMFKIHDEEAKLYECNVCGSCFENKSGLTSHKARCQKEQKFFKCGLCAYTCHTRIELSDHWIKHGEGGPHQFVCPVCGKIYVSNRKMMKHLRKYHKELEPATSAIQFDPENVKNKLKDSRQKCKDGTPKPATA